MLILSRFPGWWSEFIEGLHGSININVGLSFNHSYIFVGGVVSRYFLAIHALYGTIFYISYSRVSSICIVFFLPKRRYSLLA